MFVFAEVGKKASWCSAVICNEWLHGECVRVTEQDADQIEDYFCDTWTLMMLYSLVSLAIHAQLLLVG